MWYRGGMTAIKYPHANMSAEDKAQYRLDIKTDKQGPDDCWIFKGSRTANGYGNLSGGTLLGEFKATVYAHILSWSLAHGRWPAQGMHVMHSCDTPPCVNPRHLIEGTAKQNASDRNRTGRWFGAGTGKLSDEQVRIIRSSTRTQRELALMLGVSQKTISHVRTGKTYTKVC